MARMTRDKIKEVNAELAKYMDYLEGRWQDEKEYEDFADYQNAVEKKVAALGMRFAKMTKRPFAVRYATILTDGEAIGFEMKVNSKGIFCDELELGS